MKLRNVIFKTNNIVIQLKRSFENSTTCVIMGSGYSITVDETDKIVNCDPLCFPPSGKDYGKCDVISVFFPFECEGLQKAGMELANFINNNMKKYSNIILHGHSKCGVCFLNLTQWLERQVNVVSISAPINQCGTPVTSPKFYERLNAIQTKAFSYIFSNHNVDKDLQEKSEFLMNFNSSCLEKHRYRIIVSVCGGITFNPVEWVLNWVDKSKEINGDGIIPAEAQIPSFSDYEMIYATHATSMKKSIKFVKEFL